MLSCYDATLRLAGGAALAGGGGAGPGEPTFCAHYPPMGQMPAVVEQVGAGPLNFRAGARGAVRSSPTVRPRACPLLCVLNVPVMGTLS